MFERSKTTRFPFGRREPGATDLELISAYTRAEALADGVLVDVTETAREADLNRRSRRSLAARLASMRAPRRTPICTPRDAPNGS